MDHLLPPILKWVEKVIRQVSFTSVLQEGAFPDISEELFYLLRLSLASGVWEMERLLSQLQRIGQRRFAEEFDFTGPLEKALDAFLHKKEASTWDHVLPSEGYTWLYSYTFELKGILEKPILDKARTIVKEGMGTAGKKGGTEDEVREKLRTVLPDLTEHRLQAIVRTETMRCYNMGQLIQMKNTEGLVEGVEYCAVLDSRTTDMCQERDGLILRINDSRLWDNTPPLHPNCRSVLLPVMIIDGVSEERWEGDAEKFDTLAVDHPGMVRPKDKEHIQNILNPEAPPKPKLKTPPKEKPKKEPEPKKEPTPQESKKKKLVVPKGMIPPAKEATEDWEISARQKQIDTWLKYNGPNAIKFPPTAPKFKTSLEAEEWMKKHNMADHVSLRAFDLPQAQAVVDSITENLHKMPELREWLHYVGNGEWFKDVLRNYPAKPYEVNGIQRFLNDPVFDTAYAFTTPDSRFTGVIVCERWAKDARVAFKSIEASMSTAVRWHPPADRDKILKSCINHEMGHVIDHLLMYNTPSTGSPDLGGLNLFELYDELKKNPEAAKVLSAYGATKKQEMVAEAWAEYTCWHSPRPLAAQIGKHLESEYQRQKNSVDEGLNYPK
ncbi:MAG: hypothetical protein EOM17_01960 [Synergistales bacterium]|nr:hypothetical protein [Synergistales bacterium]